MKKSTILAMYVFITMPFALVAQEPAVKILPLVNENPKEERVNDFMKTNPMSPSIVLRYTEGTAPMNTTSKEELKMPAGAVSTATASDAKKRNNKPVESRMNLSAKEKLKMGL